MWGRGQNCSANPKSSQCWEKNEFWEGGETGRGHTCGREGAEKWDTWWMGLQATVEAGFPLFHPTRKTRCLGGEPPRVARTRGQVMVRCPCLCCWNRGSRGIRVISLFAHCYTYQALTIYYMDTLMEIYWYLCLQWEALHTVGLPHCLQIELQALILLGAKERSEYYLKEEINLEIIWVTRVGKGSHLFFPGPQFPQTVHAPTVLSARPSKRLCRHQAQTLPLLLLPQPLLWGVLTPKMLCAFAWESGNKEDLMNWESIICSGEAHYMISLRKTKNIPYE